MSLFGEKAPKAPIKLKDPDVSWKFKVVKDFTAKHIREKLMEDGKIIYNLKTLDEVRANVQTELDTLWDENKRLLNPQTFIINLSPSLQKGKRRTT